MRYILLLACVVSSFALVGCETDRDHRGRPGYDDGEYRGYGHRDRDDYYRDQNGYYYNPNYQYPYQYNNPNYQYTVPEYRH